MRLAVIFVPALAVLITGSAASAAVRLVSVTSPVHPGSIVRLSVTAFGNAHCTPRLRYRLKPQLHVDGLATKGTLFGGIVSWRWRMPAHATRGTWTVDVSCGTSGTLHATFVVR